MCSSDLASNSPVSFKKESQDEKDMMIMAKYSLCMQSLIDCSLGVAGSLIYKIPHMRPHDLATRSQGRRVANRGSRDLATLRPGRWVAGRTWACRGVSSARGFADKLSLTGNIRGWKGSKLEIGHNHEDSGQDKGDLGVYENQNKK